MPNSSAAGAGDRILDDEDRRQGRADFDDKHHRILRDHPRIELDERFLDRALQDFRIEERPGANTFGDELRAFRL